MFAQNKVVDLGRFRATCSGRREAVCDFDTGRRYTFAELDRRADSMAAFLTEVTGLRAGDRVAFCSENNVAFLDAFLMSYKTGIIITSYNCMMGKKELLSLVAQETPKVVFYSGDRRGVMEPFRTDGTEREYVAIRGEADERDRYAYENVISYRPAQAVHYETPEYEDIQMLIHTGGTTGRPKAAMMSYRALLCNAVSSILTVGVSERDCQLQLLPFFHTAGWNSLMLPVFVAGGRTVYTSEFEAGKVLRAVAAEQPTVCIGVETMYKRLADHADFPAVDLSSFRWMVNGAAPISRQTLETYWRKRVKLINAYGMTEIGPENLVPPVDAMTLEEIRDKWESVGRAMLFNQMKIIDEEGREAQSGERGEMLFRGPLTFSGYWRNEEQTGSVVKNGWIHTGDIAYCDPDGFYYICGRKKNMFISGGENIYPVEIEYALAGHPAVDFACVIGVADEQWGEVGKALIVLKPGAAATENELRRLVKEECTSIKVPKYIQFVDKIPRTSVGKLDMTEIRRLYGSCSGRPPDES
ncbi:MAG: AMP-binding protein [Gracilibacteraceae bacterium]|jgi:fatty-acyl-CoA synthase|nr:AMP-binding protein [Gracilibacteraceae bacterium]